MPLLGMKQSLFSIATCLIADAMLDALRNFSYERMKLQSHSKGTNRIIASLEANVIKNSCELGHLFGPLKRGSYFNITKRFDWFCGLYSNAIPDERQRAMKRFWLFLFIVIFIIYLV